MTAHTEPNRTEANRRMGYCDTLPGFVVPFLAEPTKNNTQRGGGAQQDDDAVIRIPTGQTTYAQCVLPTAQHTTHNTEKYQRAGDCVHQRENTNANCLPRGCSTPFCTFRPAYIDDCSFGHSREWIWYHRTNPSHRLSSRVVTGQLSTPQMHTERIRIQLKVMRKNGETCKFGPGERRRRLADTGDGLMVVWP